MNQVENSGQARAIRVMFGGDVMLGRHVKECILRYGSGYPLGLVAPLLRMSDLAVVNLECALTSSLERWPGEPKAYYFGGRCRGRPGARAHGCDSRVRRNSSRHGRIL